MPHGVKCVSYSFCLACDESAGPAARRMEPGLQRMEPERRASGLEVVMPQEIHEPLVVGIGQIEDRQELPVIVRGGVHAATDGGARSELR